MYTYARGPVVVAYSHKGTLGVAHEYEGGRCECQPLTDAEQCFHVLLAVNIYNSQL